MPSLRQHLSRRLALPMVDTSSQACPSACLVSSSMHPCPTCSKDKESGGQPLYKECPDDICYPYRFFTSSASSIAGQVRSQGFQCEVCGMNVHRGCQLRANFSQSCPGKVSQVSVVFPRLMTLCCKEVGGVGVDGHAKRPSCHEQIEKAEKVAKRSTQRALVLQ